MNESESSLLDTRPLVSLNLTQLGTISQSNGQKQRRKKITLVQRTAEVKLSFIIAVQRNLPCPSRMIINTHSNHTLEGNRL